LSAESEFDPAFQDVPDSSKHLGHLSVERRMRLLIVGKKTH
jgi:hypothetical protein